MDALVDSSTAFKRILTPHSGAQPDARATHLHNHACRPYLHSFCNYRSRNNLSLHEISGLIGVKASYSVKKRDFDLRGSQFKEFLHRNFDGIEGERLLVILLSSRGNIFGAFEGSATNSYKMSFTYRSIFEIPLAAGAHAIALAHNHPSGNPLPSKDDLRTTAYISQVGNILNVPLLDHIIFGGTRLYSMAARGEL